MRAVIITFILVLVSCCSCQEKQNNTLNNNDQQNLSERNDSAEPESREGVERLKCGEKEFQETRSNYEKCASEKIGSVTDWLQKVASGEQGEQHVVIGKVCSHVQDLLHSCGDELGWCFTADQVEETKNVQKAGIRDILSRHLPEDKVESCLEKASINAKGTDTPVNEIARPEPRALLLDNLAENTTSTLQGTTENHIEQHVFDLLDDSGESDDNDTKATVEYQTVHTKKDDAAGAYPTTLRALLDSSDVEQEKSTTTTRLRTAKTEKTTDKPITMPKKPQNLPSSTSSTPRYPTECDNPATCSGFSRVMVDSYVITTLLILSIFVKGF